MVCIHSICPPELNQVSYNPLFLCVVQLMLRPVAQLCSQVHMDQNNCLVIDCSFSLPEVGRLFTLTHSVNRYHMTFQSHFCLIAFFFPHFSVCIFKLAEPRGEIISLSLSLSVGNSLMSKLSPISSSCWRGKEDSP